jgi:hypothetical protein
MMSYITEQLTGSKEEGGERDVLNNGVRLVCVALQGAAYTV